MRAYLSERRRGSLSSGTFSLGLLSNFDRSSLLPRQTRQPTGETAREDSCAPPLMHDFSRIRVGSTTRNPSDSPGEDEDTTVGEMADTAPADVPTPAPAPPVFPPQPPPPASTDKCSVKSGPDYTPSGTIPVNPVGSKKTASFSLDASFDTSGTGVKASCCEVRQYIKWDQAYHNSKGGPPHSGFPSSAKPDTWIEDRDTADKRYGHRSGSHSDPQPKCGDEYKTGSSQDMANGDVYCGKDNPTVSSSRTGQWQFQLKVIDTCNSSAVKASSSVITINW